MNKYTMASDSILEFLKVNNKVELSDCVKVANDDDLICIA